MPAESTPPTPVRVWDLPTRVFHWLLATCVVALVITGNIGGNALVWHMKLGLTVGALLLFRVLWGLVGGRWSRFASFVYAPGTVLRYWRGQASPSEHLEVGHNPLGSFSVFALLILLALQVATGTLADDDIATTGPLNRFVSNATASLATGWHTEWGKAIVFGLVVLHVSAIVYYLRRKKLNLVRPMWTGDKPLPPGTPASTDTPATRALAAVLFAGCAALAVWVDHLGG
jgi:cytochrome b